MGSAREPFCPACETWKEEKALGTLAGNEDEVIALLKSGEVERLAGYSPRSTDANRDRPVLLLSAAFCPRCRDQSSIAVKLERTTMNDKGEEEQTELTHLSYPGEALAHFEALFGVPEEVQRRP
jgi:hypothetical protein